MPYITRSRATGMFDGFSLEDLGNIAETGGDLNYLFCRIAADFLSKKNDGKPRYADMNEVSGAFINAFLEYYDRVVRPYEDRASAKPDAVDPFGRLVDYAKGIIDQIPPNKM